MSATLLPLSAMMLVQAMTAMALVAVPVLAPEIAAALDVDTATVGLYQSIAFAGAACFTLPSGTLVLRHGGVRVNRMSAVLSALGLVITARRRSLGWERSPRGWATGSRPRGRATSSPGCSRARSMTSRASARALSGPAAPP